MLGLSSTKDYTMVSLRIPLRIVLLLLASPALCLAQAAPGGLPPVPLAVAPAVPLSAAEKQSIQARVDALHKEANDRRSAADTKQREDKAACPQRFLVNACLEDADTRHRNELGEVRKLDLEGNRLQRELKARERAEEAALAPTGAAQQAEAIRQRQAQQAQLRDFEKGGVDRATRKQQGAAQEAAQEKQLAQHAAALQQQAQRAAEARLRAEEARKQTAAYKASQEKARQRAADAAAKP